MRLLKSTLRTMDLRPVQPLVAPRERQPFYGSAAWRALAAQVIKTRGRCERCGTTSGRLYADHIVELRDGGAPLDPLNVQALCSRCHGRKTHAARKAREAAR